MSELVNMKISPEEQAEYSEGPSSTKPSYPYGLQVNLDDEAIEKLGLAALPQVGQFMMLTARVEVCTVSQYDSTDSDGPSKSLSLQITDMSLGADEQKKDAASVLYGG